LHRHPDHLHTLSRGNLLSFPQRSAPHFADSGSNGIDVPTSLLLRADEVIE
jgi:hypothetical protein